MGQYFSKKTVDGSASNIDRIQLQVYSGSAVETNPSYYWAKTTSALQTLANRVGDVISLGNDIDSIIALSSKTDEIQYLYDDRDKLTGATNSLYSELAKFKDIHTQLTALVAIYDDIKIGGTNNINTLAEAVYKAKVETVGEAVYKAKVETVGEAVYKAKVETVADDITTITAVNNNKANIDGVEAKLTDLSVIVTNMAAILDAKNQATTATNKAGEASSYAATAKGYRDELTALQVQAQTLDAGQTASVSYNVGTGVLTVSVPKGEKGDRGEAFQVNSVGLIADRGLYDAQIKGFSFLALDEATIYFKLSATSGDWSMGAPFGKGDKGDIGIGIAGIAKTATNGNVDTYTITYTDSNTTTFDVVNGSVTSVNGRVGAITLTKSDIGLANVDNTSDVNKPISIAQQAGLDAKENITDNNAKLALKADKANPIFTGLLTEQVSVSTLTLGATSSVQTYAATANFTIVDDLVDGESVTMILTSGGFTATYPTITWWDGADGTTEPTLGTTDKIKFEKIGTVLYGTHVGSIV